MKTIFLNCIGAVFFLTAMSACSSSDLATSSSNRDTLRVDSLAADSIDDQRYMNGSNGGVNNNNPNGVNNIQNPSGSNTGAGNSGNTINNNGLNNGGTNNGLNGGGKINP